jgi:hypothetical protein
VDRPGAHSSPNLLQRLQRPAGVTRLRVGLRDRLSAASGRGCVGTLNRARIQHMDRKRRTRRRTLSVRPAPQTARFQCAPRSQARHRPRSRGTGRAFQFDMPKQKLNCPQVFSPLRYQRGLGPAHGMRAVDGRIEPNGGNLLMDDPGVLSRRNMRRIGKATRKQAVLRLQSRLLDPRSDSVSGRSPERAPRKNGKSRWGPRTQQMVARLRLSFSRCVSPGICAMWAW